LLLAAFSRHVGALDWAFAKAGDMWGPVALSSSPFDFTETEYYASTMGPDLKKVFWAFLRPIDPCDLAVIKRQTNGWEEEFVAAAKRGEVLDDSGGRIVEERPLNLDPGYLTTAKLVLASTKDHAHRINHALLPSWAMGASRVDVSRLSPRRLSTVLFAGARVAQRWLMPRSRWPRLTIDTV
jgi:hypothetical protein